MISTYKMISDHPGAISLRRKVTSAVAVLGVGVWDGDAQQFVIGIEPEVPFGALGLNHKMAEVLRLP